MRERERQREEPEAPEGRYKALVEKIIPHGKRGAYAVAWSPEIGAAVTFSLDSDVWQENTWPDLKEYVILYGVREMSGGWRAGHARFVRPTDPEARKEPRKDRNDRS